MIIMTFDKQTNNIITYQYDYGIPVAFRAKAEKGFAIGEKIVFVFDTDTIADKVYTIDSNNFYFEVALTKTEADALFNGDVSVRSIAYSAKRNAANGDFLETLLNGFLVVKGTVRYG